MFGSLLIKLLSLSRAQKRMVQVLADSAILIAVFMLSMFVRLDDAFWSYEFKTWAALLPVIPLTIYVFARLGFYRAVIRYIAGRAFGVILLGSVLSGLFLAIFAKIFDVPVPRSVPMIYAAFLVLVIGGVRFVFREIVALQDGRGKEQVVIYGAGAAGRQLLQSLRQSTQYRAVAFLDDSPQTQGATIGGLPVYPPKQIGELIVKDRVTSVLLALPSSSRKRRSEILRQLEAFPLRLRTIPGLEDILAGRAKLGDIEDVRIEDLLGRDPVPPEAELLGANIVGKVVMVTGAGGSIGSELCRQILRQRPKQLVLYERSEIALYTIDAELSSAIPEGSGLKIVALLGDVRDRDHVTKVIRNFGVQTIYHAAAYKHVPLVENNVTEGIRNNVLGTRAVVEAAVACQVENFTLISTDKAVRPTNIMGASKRLAELVCQAAAAHPGIRTRISMVRFGNVLGSSGSVIQLFRKQIAKGGPLTVTHPDITRFFMTIPEAAQLVIQAAAMARGGDVFVLDMGEPVRIADMAAQMARLHGLKPVLASRGEVSSLSKSEIAVVFTKLRPGEKLYEELLIGNNPVATRHERIMSATEASLPPAELEAVLDRVTLACKTNDVLALRKIMIEAQTGYAPSSEIVDYLTAAGCGADVVPLRGGARQEPRLVVV